MDKQVKSIIIKIDEELKDKFTAHAGSKQMNLSARIKYLMKMDVEGKIIINNG